MGEYNGQPITDVDLDSFEDRPWRKPGKKFHFFFILLTPFSSSMVMVWIRDKLIVPRFVLIIGADITDYFNYGFNEVTWKAYCAQQKMFRENKKVIIYRETQLFIFFLSLINIIWWFI